MKRNNNTKKGDFVVRYTTKDVMDKLEEINQHISEIHAQAKLTNGKVKFHTKLIYASFGFTFTMSIVLLGYLLK